jgi:oxygen-independent coproporphyrinogen-3 oxidase
LRAIEETKQAGLQRINADLMSGIPGQTVDSFLHTLDRILQLNLSHLSVYSLILEEGTPLERLVGEGKVTLPAEDVSYSMYEMTTDILARAGLRRYEISNYAEPGQESLHNKVYWHYEPYAAFGVGACSFIGRERRTNIFDVREYIEWWSTAEAVLQNSGPWQTERLDIKTQISEAMIMGLRLTEGIDLNKMQQRFGIDVLKYYGQEIQTLLDKKMAACEAGMLRLTPYGMRYGNRAFEAFV